MYFFVKVLAQFGCSQCWERVYFELRESVIVD